MSYSYYSKVNTGPSAACLVTKIRIWTYSSELDFDLSGRSFKNKSIRFSL